MIIYMGEVELEVVHHLTPGLTNVLTKWSANSKAMIGLHGKGSPTEIRDITKLALSKGKLVKYDNFFDAISTSDIKLFCQLGHNIITYHSYTFCSLYILEILYAMDESEITTLGLLFKIRNEIKDNSDNKKEMY